ncbi:MAG: histidine phosphatase family protein [Burkholderiaceae bacterium]
MKVWLLRHPKPDVPDGLCYGAMDVPIVHAHRDELLEHLPARLPQDIRIHCSPLTRCQLLAHGLSERGFGPVRTAHALREMSFGRWEGHLWKDLPAEEVSAWRADLAGYAPPGGESLAEVARRTLAYVDSLPEDEHALLVTHAGVIQTLVRGLREQPLQRMGFRVDYGQLVRFERQEQQWVMLEHESHDGRPGL